MSRSTLTTADFDKLLVASGVLRAIGDSSGAADLIVLVNEQRALGVVPTEPASTEWQPWAGAQAEGRTYPAGVYKGQLVDVELRNGDRCLRQELGGSSYGGSAYWHTGLYPSDKLTELDIVKWRLTPGEDMT